MDSFASFFGLKKSNSTSTTAAATKHNQQEDYNRKMRDVVVVLYQDRYYDIHFRDFREGINEATVADLKERCKRVTGVTLATMKLKVSGGKNIYIYMCMKKVLNFFLKCVANVKDETATLPSTGIHSGSLVLLTGERFNVMCIHTRFFKKK